MKQKGLMLAGRLGMPGRGTPVPDKSSSYGINRLGISADADRGPEPFDPSPHDPTKAKPQQRTDVLEERADSEYRDLPEMLAAARPPRPRIPAAMAVAVGGGVVLVLVFLGWLCFGGSDTPESAAASVAAQPQAPSVAQAESAQDKPARPAGPAHGGSHERAAKYDHPLSTPLRPARIDFAGRAGSALRPSAARPSPGRARPRPADHELGGYVADASRRPKPVPASKPTTQNPAEKPAKKPPTQPEPILHSGPPDLLVSCIMRGLGGPTAIINGVPVSEGDTVKGVKVVRIGDFSVEVEHNGQRFLLGTSTPRTQTPRRNDTDEEDAPPKKSESKED